MYHIARVTVLRSAFFVCVIISLDEGIFPVLDFMSTYVLQIPHYPPPQERVPSPPPGWFWLVSANKRDLSDTISEVKGFFRQL